MNNRHKKENCAMILLMKRRLWILAVCGMICISSSIEAACNPPCGACQSCKPGNQCVSKCGPYEACCDGKKCYDYETEYCCESGTGKTCSWDKNCCGSSCCDLDEICCGGQCADPKDCQECVDGQVITCGGDPDKECCGGQCITKCDSDNCMDCNSTSKACESKCDPNETCCDGGCQPKCDVTTDSEICSQTLSTLCGGDNCYELS
ncbi:MAG: hypothetical protein PHQ00_04640, partial [Phycisphaerae bacterium]|nr:hypothetical protein [Phycisphaerae bacterium]